MRKVGRVLTVHHKGEKRKMGVELTEKKLISCLRV